jgi:hypothetical protein
MPPEIAETPMKSASSFEKVLVLTLSWLIPGFGFFRYGRKLRGILFFVVLEGAFLAGAMLHGSVLIPDFDRRAEGFNLVTILTFFTQLFNGGMSFLSMMPELFGPKYAILPSNEAAPLADLGSFLLLVSGGMNYFVLVSTYDHFYGRKAGLGRTAGETTEDAVA